MTDLTLHLGGHSYTIACEPGDEAHVHALGAMIEARLANLPSQLAHNDARGLLFAALMLADELDTLQRDAAHIDTAAPGAAPASDPALRAIATRLENLADALECQGMKP